MVTEPLPIPSTVPGPAISAYPAELLRLWMPQRGPVTLTPSISVSEEYNDNIFVTDRNHQWDFVTNFSPGITLTVNRPTYQLSAGYTFSGQIYAREESLNSVFERQYFLFAGLYQVTPTLTFSASDSFVLDQNTNLVSGFGTGRQKSWNNIFTPGVAWQITPVNALRISATHNVLQFEGSGRPGGNDSNTYSLQTLFEHTFTARFTGSIGYQFEYLAPEGSPDSTTHTPLVGFGYQLTPTLSFTLRGGPAFTETGGENFVSPVGSARLLQQFRVGSVGLQYDRAVSVAGGFGGTTDTQTVSAGLALTSLQRGLVVAFGPSYSIAKSLSNRQSERIDVSSLNLNLGVAYELSRFMTVFGSYAFFHQHTGRASSAAQGDIDQNRIRFGLQFGYPITFD